MTVKHREGRREGLGSGPAGPMLSLWLLIVCAPSSIDSPWSGRRQALPGGAGQGSSGLVGGGLTYPARREARSERCPEDGGADAGLIVARKQTRAAREEAQARADAWGVGCARGAYAEARGFYRRQCLQHFGTPRLTALHE